MGAGSCDVTDQSDEDENDVSFEPDKPFSEYFESRLGDGEDDDAKLYLINTDLEADLSLSLQENYELIK